MYPLKVKPVFQNRIWGGTRLRSALGKAVPRELEPVGESWELADLPPGTVKADSAGAAADGSLASAITNGPWAGRTLHDAWLEMRSRDGALPAHFPLLIKFLDAGQDLSVQVHPDEAYCRSHPGSHLKSECWYILHAEPGAKIYKGVRPGVTREQFREALRAGDVEPLLGAIRVRTGDCHYLPSGTVHAMGAGILAAEVQTPSDTTFRVFDWNRLGADGRPRALHVEEALACIDFSPAAPRMPVDVPAEGAGTRIVTCEFFTLDRVAQRQGERRSLGAAMAAWVILEGQGVLTVEGHPPTAFARGETLLLPAGMKGAEVRTITEAAWLEVRMPREQGAAGSL